MCLLQLALQQPVESVRVTWNVQVGKKSASVFTVPKHLPPLLSNNYFTAVGLVSNRELTSEYRFCASPPT